MTHTSSKYELEGPSSEASPAHEALWGNLVTPSAFVKKLHETGVTDDNCVLLVLPPDFFSCSSEIESLEDQCCPCFGSAGDNRHCGESPGRDCYGLVLCPDANVD